MSHSRQSDDYADIEDNDFAEFDFEDETDESLKVTDEEDDDFETMETEDDEAEVEVESDGEDEFSHFEDDEEFEGFKSDDLTDNPDPEEFDNVPVSPKPKPSHEKPTPPPLKQPIKIVNIPAHLRSVCHRFVSSILEQTLFDRPFLLDTMTKFNSGPTGRITTWRLQ